MKNILNRFLIVTLLALPATQVLSASFLNKESYSTAKEKLISYKTSAEKTITDKFKQIKKQDKKTLAKFAVLSFAAAYLGCYAAKNGIKGYTKILSHNPISIKIGKRKAFKALLYGISAICSAKLANGVLKNKA